MTKIVIARRGQRWLVNLTDGSDVWSKRFYETPGRALASVARHLDAGYSVAFASAYRELTHAAARYRTDQAGN